MRRSRPSCWRRRDRPSWSEGMPPAKLVEAIAAGQAELGLFLINVLTAPGLDVVGPVPAALDQQIVYTTGVGRKAAQAEIARAFVAFLQTAGAKAVLKARGLTPA